MNHFIVFGEKHLRYLIDQYLIYYRTLRPHQSKDNLPLTGTVLKEASPLRAEDLVCEERLGGLLKHYRRAG